MLLPERAVPDELERTALECPWDHLTWEQCKELSPEVHRLLVQRKINTQRKSFFFFFRLTLGIWIFISANINLSIPALRLIDTIFSLCVLSLCHILSHPGLWVKDPVNWLSSSRSSTERPGKLEKGIVEEAKVDPHHSPLLHPWACERWQHLTLCTSYLCFHGREKAIRTNNGRGAWTQTSRKKPFSQVLLSASHHP